MKTRLLIISAIVFVVLLVPSFSYGTWREQPLEELWEQSQTIFVGNVTSVQIVDVEKTIRYSEETDGVEKNIVENYTMRLDEYTVKISSFFKNPQNFDTITVREPTVSAGIYQSTIAGYEVGDKVLFYLKNIDGTNTYSPESQKIEIDNHLYYFQDEFKKLANEKNSNHSVAQIESAPLKQFKSGVPVGEITCKENLVLIQKHNGFPACVKPETKSKLMQRDWIENKDGITVQLSFCGEAGFDSDGNPNKSNSTHIWDGNYCQWRITDQLDSMFYDLPEQLKRVLQSCEQKRIAESTNYTWPDGTKYYLTLVGYDFSNATHIITNNTCEWQTLEQYESAYGDMTSSYMEKIVPTIDDFKQTLSESYDINTIFSKFGEPHKDIGSGIHIYVYELNGNTEVWIGYVDDIWYVKHVDLNGNVLEELFEKNEYNTPDGLKGVFGNCACQERVKSNPDTMERCIQPEFIWENSTHYIDNNICEWREK